MLNIEEIKTKIMEIMNQKGPVLPVHISKEISLPLIFSSAILSELANEKRIKISNMKIGSSPLYFLPGHEQQLENFQDNIGGVRKTALLKLKQNKVLEDEKQEPAIRVALRSIRDFAIPLKSQEKIIWKYFTISNEEAENLLNIYKKIPEIPKKEEEKQKLILKKKIPKKPEKFLQEIKNFLLKKDIELLGEVSVDKKEVVAKVGVNSNLGKISFLMIAKDKKRITETDLTLAYQKAIHKKMPCLFISYEELSKKTQTWLEDYKDIIKVLKIF